MSQSGRDYVVGIDNGTQALQVVLVDPKTREVLAEGEYNVPMQEGPNGEKEHLIADWGYALHAASCQAITSAAQGGVMLGNCLGICPSGQMHGECIMLGDGAFHPVARLWCDGRNAAEAAFLTELFGDLVTVAQRSTISRWLWTILNRQKIAEQCVGLTTPSGVIAALLGVGTLYLGVGDASGMFPIDPRTGSYDANMIDQFDKDIAGRGLARINPIRELLPYPMPVGKVIGHVDEAGSQLTGFPVRTPIFPPEGDQPTTLAACYATRGTLAVSGGTSICANLLSDGYKGVHPGIDQFVACDGTPFNMCHVQNGTGMMNTVAGLITKITGMSFADVMKLASAAPVDCGGLLFLATAEPEHGLGFPSKAISALIGGTADNWTLGNQVRAAMLSPLLAIRRSSQELARERLTANEAVVSGGIVRSDWIAKMFAGVFNLPVRTYGEAERGSAYGAALMALYGVKHNEGETWEQFLRRMRPPTSRVFLPDPHDVKLYNRAFVRFEQMVAKVEPRLLEIYG